MSEQDYGRLEDMGERLTVWFHGFHGDSPVKMGEIYHERSLPDPASLWFRYDPGFVALGIETSPIALPFDRPESKSVYFGCHKIDVNGAFADSLPDSWGECAVWQSVPSVNGWGGGASMGPYQLLAFIGDRAMGALTYEPSENCDDPVIVALHSHGVELDGLIEPPRPVDIADEAERSLAHYREWQRETKEWMIGGDRRGRTLEIVDRPHMAAADRPTPRMASVPAGGTLPKALVSIDAGGGVFDFSENLPPGHDAWLVKYHRGDSDRDKAEGVMEHAIADMARKSGIDMAETRLLGEPYGVRCFATRRFDRPGSGRRVHMVSMANLAGVDPLPESSMFGYAQLIGHVRRLMPQSPEAERETFRRMVFNVVVGNRDDHLKNFSFLMDPDGTWSCSPAYDLTYTADRDRGHKLSVAPNRDSKIRLDDVLAVQRQTSLARQEALEIVDEVREGTRGWIDLATDLGIPDDYAREINQHIQDQLDLLSPNLGPGPSSGGNPVGDRVHSRI